MKAAEGRVGIKDIAEIANVDVSTVSRALAGSNRVNPNTSKRILEIANQLDYRPNTLAKSLVAGKSQTVGIIIPEINNTFYAGVVSSIEKVLTAEGYSMILSLSHYKPEEEQHCLELLDSKCVDGIICFGALIAQQQTKLTIPCVQLDIASEFPDQDVVSSNHILGVKIGLEYLFSLGHTRIAFVTNVFTTQDRRNAYSIYMRERGYEDRVYIFQGDIKNEKGGYIAAKDLVGGENPPTALFCANDYIAIGAIKALRDLGLQVPQDVSVLGFDDSEMLDYLDCALTSIRQHKHELGEQAARILVMRMREKEQKAKKNPLMNISLKPELVKRNSCAPCKNKKTE